VACISNVVANGNAIGIFATGTSLITNCMVFSFGNNMVTNNVVATQAVIVPAPPL
jgi:hypothetical protein